MGRLGPSPWTVKTGVSNYKKWMKGANRPLSQASRLGVAMNTAISSFLALVFLVIYLADYIVHSVKHIFSLRQIDNPVLEIREQGTAALPRGFSPIETGFHLSGPLSIMVG